MADKGLYGVYVGVVDENAFSADAKHSSHRINVKLSAFDDANQKTASCRIVTIAAGQDRGLYWVPEPKDEVLIAFEHGDFNRPFVLGSLWTVQGKGSDAPWSNKDKDNSKNDTRMFKSRKGHTLTFNDNADAAWVELKTKSGHFLKMEELDSGSSADKGKITLKDSSGKLILEFDTDKKQITLDNQAGDMIISTKEKLKISAKTIEVSSTGDTSFSASNWKVKAQANTEIKASGQGTYESSGPMTIKGATVNIN